MEKMRAVFLVKQGDASEAFEIRETNIPTPGANQVLVENELFGLNFAEVPMRYGMYKEAPPMPFVPGYDAVGRVRDVGENVDKEMIGRRVAVMARFGTYAQYCVTDQAGISEIPEEMNGAKASAIGVQYCTAYYSAMVLNNLMPGDRVLIHAAAGGVGSALIQLCKWKGCIVVGTAGSDEKIEHARRLGADHVINYRKDDYVEQCRKILGKERLDVTFNAIAGSTFKKDLKLLGAGGRLVLYGAAERMGKKGGRLATLSFLWKMGLVMPILLMAKSRSILGVNILKLADYKPHVIQKCFRELIELYEQDVIDPVVEGEYNVTDLAEAHHKLENRKTMGKIVVRW